MPDPHHSDLIFNHQPSISHLLSSLKRSTLTIHNRLTSIHSDATFVSLVAASHPGRPLVANERCGSWYVPPQEKQASAYFKSTDGHERAWKFSTRRLNLHLIDLIENNDGVIIVDSTRRGKRMPDALSTTIPVWCTIINQILLPSNPNSHILHLPPSLPPTTHAQITALLPSFLESLRSLNLTLPTSLTKPLRPLWITQDSTLPTPSDASSSSSSQPSPIFDDYRPVICCTASRRVISVGSEAQEAGYIQGAGDDSENWGLGLTPPIFWSHTQDLLQAAEADLPSLIASLVQQQQDDQLHKNNKLTITLVPNSISVCASPPPPPPENNTNAAAASPPVVIVILTHDTTPKESWPQSPLCIKVGLGKHKTASKNLRLALSDICSFVAKTLYDRGDNYDRDWRLVVACDTGRDLSVGTALALSLFLFDDEGKVRPRDGEEVGFTKTMVKMRLGRIMTAYPEGNPSRATLQSVNSFLMDWRR